MEQIETKEIPKNIKLWTTALQSNKYPQIIDYLRNPQGFSCLGLACEVSGLGKWHTVEGRDNFEYRINGDKCITGLPLGVQKWLGVRTRLVRFKGDFLHKRWLGLDNVGDLESVARFRFHYLAQFIEERWEDFI